MREKLRDAVLAGIKKAQKAYLDIYGDWVEEASEYWITTYVAKEVAARLKTRWVGVEISSNLVRKLAPKPKPGNVSELAKDKKHDIVVFFQNRNKQKPFAVIEMKSVSQGARKAPLDDVRKVIAILKATSMRFGVVGYYFCARKDRRGQRSAADKAWEYARNLKEGKRNKRGKKEWKGAEEIAARDGLTINLSKELGPSSEKDSVHVWDDGEHAWIAGCLVIEPASR